MLVFPLLSTPTAYVGVEASQNIQSNDFPLSFRCVTIEYNFLYYYVCIECGDKIGFIPLKIPSFLFVKFHSFINGYDLIQPPFDLKPRIVIQYLY